MKVAELKAYEVFKNKFGEKDAETVFQFFEATKSESIIQDQIDDRLTDLKKIFATKEDIYQLRVEMKEQKSELIKWMFIFWIGQLGATIAIILLFIKR